MKKLKSVILQFTIGAIVASLFIVACNKSNGNMNSSGPTKALTVHLADDPSNFSSVLIDIKYVEVKIDTNLEHDGNFDNEDHDQDNDNKDHDKFGKWDTLSISPGVYDIMKLRNGLDTVLGKANIPQSRIEKIRLTLGNNNSVVVDNVSHPLLLAPGSNNYAYVKVEENDLDASPAGGQDLWVDFDLAASIKEHNGSYYLKPFLKAFGIEKFGRIEGRVIPHDALPVVKATQGTETFTAVPEHEGEFKIRGLKEGTYSVLFKGSNGYQDTTVNNVEVHAGKEIHLPTITLHK